MDSLFVWVLLSIKVFSQVPTAEFWSSPSLTDIKVSKNIKLVSWITRGVICIGAETLVRQQTVSIGLDLIRFSLCQVIQYPSTPPLSTTMHVQQGFLMSAWVLHLGSYMEGVVQSRPCNRCPLWTIPNLNLINVSIYLLTLLMSQYTS